MYFTIPHYINTYIRLKWRDLLLDVFIGPLVKLTEQSATKFNELDVWTRRSDIYRPSTQLYVWICVV